MTRLPELKMTENVQKSQEAERKDGDTTAIVYSLKSDDEGMICENAERDRQKTGLMEG